MLLFLVLSFSPFALPLCCGRREIFGKAGRTGRGMGHHGGGRQRCRPRPLQQPLAEAVPCDALPHHEVLLLFQPGPPWVYSTLDVAGHSPCCLLQGTLQGLAVRSCTGEARGNEITRRR